VGRATAKNVIGQMINEVSLQIVPLMSQVNTIHVLTFYNRASGVLA
jgi:hypothetical protein